MVVKVKEPLPEEHGFLRDDLILFTSPSTSPRTNPSPRRSSPRARPRSRMRRCSPTAEGCPSLAPMSEIAGRLSVQEGAHHLLSPAGGRGVLLPGVPGVDRAHVTVIGAGAAGASAARAAVGMGAHVEIFDVNLPRLRYLDEVFDGRLQTKMSTPLDIAESVKRSDLVIGSVLIPGSRAPKLVTDDMVAGMGRGSVLVDIAIDQGGCFEGSRPTTHDDPTFAVHDTLYYCVANMPGAAPVTATRALTNATLPYIGRTRGQGLEGGPRSRRRAGSRALCGRVPPHERSRGPGLRHGPPGRRRGPGGLTRPTPVPVSARSPSRRPTRRAGPSPGAGPRRPQEPDIVVLRKCASHSWPTSFRPARGDRIDDRGVVLRRRGRTASPRRGRGGSPH